MSKYDDEYSNYYIICPYCKKEVISDTEGLDFEEDDEERSCSCGKRYYLRSEIEISHTTKPCCELNDEKHVFVENERGFKTCSVCGLVEA